MLPPAIAGTLVADLGPIVFWLLINNKVIGLVSGAVACVLIWKTDGRFKGQRPGDRRGSLSGHSRNRISLEL